MMFCITLSVTPLSVTLCQRSNLGKREGPGGVGGRGLGKREGPGW